MHRFLFRFLSVFLVVFGMQAQALFLSPDPLDPTLPGVGTNRYAYSFGDPINLMDPSGNQAEGGCRNFCMGNGLGNFFRSLFAGPGGSRSDADANMAAMPGGVAQAVRDHPFVEAGGFAASLTPLGDLRATGNAVAAGDASGVILGVVGSAPGAGDALSWIGRLTRRGDVGTLQPGMAGSFGELDRLRVPGDGLTPHHMPQAALELTTRREGGALVMTQAEHALTRTFAGRGIRTRTEDAGSSLRDVLARDVRDVRSIVGTRYNAGLRDLVEYYRRNFPDLMQR